MDKLAIQPHVRALAERIYTGLVTDAVEFSATGVKTKTDPQNMAAISFKVALMFYKEEDRLNAENLPKNQDFKLGADDLAKWSK